MGKVRFKVVRSKDPMIRHNYVGKVGTLISEIPITTGGTKAAAMLQLQFGVKFPVRQTFYKSEVRRVQPKKRKPKKRKRRK